MTGYHRVKTVTFVTVASFQKGPAEGSPMAVLTKSGVTETLELREQLEKIKNVEPVDCAFVALPQWLSGVTGEMLITLTGDERTGYAEVPRMDHHLSIEEISGVERIEARSGSSLRLFSANRIDADFLAGYGKRRKEAMLDFAEMNGSHHILAVGMPVLIQAIAWTFATGGQAASQDVATIIPRSGSVVQVDIGTGLVKFPAKQLAR